MLQQLQKFSAVVRDLFFEDARQSNTIKHNKVLNGKRENRIVDTYDIKKNTFAEDCYMDFLMSRCIIKLNILHFI